MSNPAELVTGAVQLYPLPKAYLRLRELLNDPDATMAEISAVISNDPAMTTRFLRMVNSAYFCLHSKIETVERAVAFLGVDQIHHVMLATSVIGAFAEIPKQLLDINAFWIRSVHCAVVARLLAQRCNLPYSERLFVSGLLHRIGHLILCQQLPESVRQIKEESLRKHKPVFKAERTILGYDYAQVGGELMERWELPDSLQLAVRYHTNPAEADNFILDTAIVHVASVITTAAAWKSEDDEPVPDFEVVAFQTVGISESDIQTLIEQADQSVAAAIELLLPNLPN